MSVSKKHFVELAEIAAAIENEHDRGNTVARLIAFGQRHNRNFSASRFAAAVDLIVAEGKVESI